MEKPSKNKAILGKIIHKYTNRNKYVLFNTMNIKKPTYYSWSEGYRFPKLMTLILMRHFLKLDINQMFDEYLNAVDIDELIKDHVKEQ